MEYTYEELERDAIEAIEKNGLFNYSQLIGFMPCARSTFYNWDLDRSNNIKVALKISRAKEFSDAFKRMKDNDSATAQIATVKILGDSDIRDALNNVHNEDKHETKKLTIVRKIVNNREDIVK